MKLPHRRQLLHLAAAAAALSVASGIVRAQTYPTRPVRLIVPFGPAGATDINYSSIQLLRVAVAGVSACLI